MHCNKEEKKNDGQKKKREIWQRGKCTHPWDVLQQRGDIELQCQGERKFQC
jgi:hypothetical protein